MVLGIFLYKKDIHYRLKIKLVSLLFYIMEFLDKLIELIDLSIEDEADNSLMSGSIIKWWYNKDIDDLRTIIETTHQWITEYQKQLIDITGISKLKIKYSHNGWYYIEVSNTHNSKVPDNFIFKQSLTNSTKYTSETLLGFEEKYLEARNNVNSLEYDEFIKIRNSVKFHFSDIYKLSRKISQLDFYQSAAQISIQRSYITPRVSSKSLVSISGWKHPVISLSENNFVNNDLSLSLKDRIHVITGPNMWWKSTFLRQNALLVLMTHIWLNIPANSAEIWLVDRIFSRVWAWDNLFLWQSTFMVEMQEISYILHHATSKSFIIIDEIWRGTSTYDGMSLAWSILKYIHDETKSLTLFATHYHEIIDHVSSLRACNNYSVAVWENENNIVFLRKVIPGGIKKSYGLEVAKLAWIPQDVHRYKLYFSTWSSFSLVSIKTAG